MTSQEQQIIDQYKQTAPVDITALATGLGLSVYETYDLPEGISGKIYRDVDDSESGYSISVNAEESYRRRRFTIAHECAHYLLHRSKIGDELSDDAMYRSDKLNSKEEFQANNLAAELLMPRNLVHQYVRSGVSNPSSLADVFDVSPAAMKVRMRYLYQETY